VGRSFFPPSREEDQPDGCLVLEEEEVGGGRLGLLKELEGSVACWLSPMPVPSVFLPSPISIGSSGMDESGTYGIKAEELDFGEVGTGGEESRSRG